MTLWGYILIGSGLLIGGLLCVRLGFSESAKRTRKRRAARKQLEDSFRVGRAQKRLLSQLARTLGEEDHICLLIGRGCFEAAVAKSDLDDRALLSVERLRVQIFKNARG